MLRCANAQKLMHDVAGKAFLVGTLKTSMNLGTTRPLTRLLIGLTIQLEDLIAPSMRIDH